LREEHAVGDIVSLEVLATQVTSGMKVAVPADYCGVAMAATAAIIAHRSENLHLVCVPITGMQGDMLIGEGLIGVLETSAVTLGEAGSAPRFVDAVHDGAIRLMDATCPAIHSGLIAAQKGVPFLPIRGIIGSDLLQTRTDWKVIDNPFADGDPIVIVPAIHPDVALFHAPEADRFGNVRIGRRRELVTMAHAAKVTLVTVERISETSLLRDEDSAAGVLPALYVSKIAVVPRGAWPIGLWGEYPADPAEIARYAGMARTREGFAAYIDDFARRFAEAA
jgi:glutaconate CoA-transferase, subunit A